MPDREPTTEDILAFMDGEERRRWDAGEGMPEERTQKWESFKTLWRSIPDPTEEQLKPPYMRYEDWQICQEGPAANKEGILNFYRRRWKLDRKAAARQKLKATAEPPNKPSSIPDHPEISSGGWDDPHPIRESDDDKAMSKNEDWLEFTHDSPSGRPTIRRHRAVKSPPPPITRKLIEFLESPLFLVGVGVVITILALVFWGALFIFAGVFFAAAVYRQDFFEGRSKRARWIGNSILFIVIVGALFAFWYFVPNPFAKPSSVAMPSPTPATFEPSTSQTSTQSPGPSVTSTPTPKPATKSHRKRPPSFPDDGEDILLGRKKRP